MAISKQSHPVERRTVTIDDVEIPNMLAHVKDKTGGRWKVSFRDSGGHTIIPKAGETWIVERNRNVSMDWYLKQRRHNNDEYTRMIAETAQGDHRIESNRVQLRTTEIDVQNPNSDNPTDLTMQAGTISLELTAISLGNASPVPLGATRRERMVTAGATTSWTLANTPVDIQTIMLFDNGTLVDPNGYGLSGKVLSFPSIAISHTLLVWYQTLP